MESRVSKNPTPLKVYGRGHYACTRCKVGKIKCSGEKPACSNCKQIGKQGLCHYESRDRKIVIMESDLKSLQAQVKYLEDIVRMRGSSPNTDSSREETPSHQWSQCAQSHEFSGLGPDSYLLSDGENEVISIKLLLVCMHNLPPQEYARARIRQACESYASEFYISDENEIDDMVMQIYRYFTNLNNEDIERASLPPVSPVLLCHLFSLLAYGEQVSNASLDSPVLSIPQSNPPAAAGLKYFSLATKLFHLCYEKPSVRYIQNALILGFFACNINRSNIVYNFFGVALRSAVGNGYHRRLEMPLNMTPEAMESHKIYQEKTKRLWWTIFVVDVIWATKLNMPVHIDYTDTDVALPTESPVLDLNDSYDPELLECYVHLAKYMSKLNKDIYGPNMRTITVNYITTDSMSQKMMVKKILSSINRFVTDFEETTLAPFKSQNILSHRGRGVANVLIRSNQTMIAVSGPAIALLFDKIGTSHTKDMHNLVQAFTRAVTAAVQNVKIFMKLYEYNKLFALGFWDSFHLFSSLMTMMLGSGPGRNVDECNQAYALLKYMADHNSISATSFLQNIGVTHQFLSETPDVLSKLDLNCTISDFVAPKDTKLTYSDSEFFDSTYDVRSDSHEHEDLKEGMLYEQLGFYNLSDLARDRLLVMTKSVLYWVVYNGLPIHVSGTARCPVFEKSPTDPGSMHLL